MTRTEEPAGGADDRTAAPPWQEPMAAERSVHFLEPRLAARRRSARAVQDRRRQLSDELAEAGMATAEYAIATLAAVGFAGLLVAIMRGDEVKGFLLAIIRQALGQ